jgi:N-acetylglutamate synthase-like GNAT family acetyltransferase
MSVFFLALEDDLVIGCTRLLTDFSRNGLLFDLIVWKERRNNGIGSQLTKNAVKFCKNRNIKKLYLMTDPRHKWLKDFYLKLGFDIAKDQVLFKKEG